ncbi:AAA family ATPase [Mycobacterium kiyosense]|uniref:DNA primase/polymerase bifunctional N-terminal domain-containing protein n=1 Tax=Mycobacterium kiyosense TaxID=2871094 RepID=A0A9P3QBD4_9MYCO|nr:AAA family ATPase [Mycobacterium kiyosense]GLB83495.1 hypothetical protein SRL2020028_27510 [Mycobacterium kiyosense]GLB94312.1 hypothetical protein SRL2020226_10880 [Mycobacterium kiyosense]GLD32645.1 hypothetical protein Mkiyose1413_45280 [Mycobacterium kiyosense]GLD37220.1 hypothetical protein Mkiyose1595_34400 [Mycobacterium kiyosense]
MIPAEAPAERDASGPFGSTARRYRRQGWLGTLPLPPKAKEQPPNGFTGQGAPYPDKARVRSWLETKADGNICLRLAEVPRQWLSDDVPPVYAGNNVDGWELFGIDVDDYEGKHGAEQLAELEAELGPLPDTVVSSARWDDSPHSGTRLFLVPKGFRYRGKACATGHTGPKHIDILYAGLRYLLVWPSIHPTGSLYEFRWGRPGGALKTYTDVPPVGDVAVLPEAWFLHLETGMGGNADAKSDMEIGELEEWALRTFRECEGEPCAEMADKLARYIDQLDDSDSHHPMNDVVWSFTKKAIEGHAGWYTVVNEYLTHWRDVTLGKRDDATLTAEALRSIDGALAKAKAEYDDSRGGYLPDDKCSAGAGDVDAWAAKAKAKVDDGVQPQRKLFGANALKAAEQPKFLAKNRIPQAAITVLVGEEGIGKSLFWVMLAAAITTGKPLRELGLPARRPGHVIVVATEDDWSSVVRPRLDVAGADLDYVHVICEEQDGSGAPTFPDDMYLITEANPAPTMVSCDAWLDTVPGNINVQRPQEARRALHPWKEAATQTGAAMVLLAHSNRMPTNNIRDRYGATMALRMKARATLYCLQDADGCLLVGPDKANGAPARVKATRYRIDAVQYFDPKPDHDGKVPLLRFDGQSHKTIKEHLADEVAAEKDRARVVSDAEKWLVAYLSDGPRMAADIYRDGAKSEFEFSRDQLKRAKKRCCAPAFHKQDSPNPDAWWWQLLTDTSGDGRG